MFVLVKAGENRLGRFHNLCSITAFCLYAGTIEHYSIVPALRDWLRLSYSEIKGQNTQFKFTPCFFCVCVCGVCVCVCVCFVFFFFCFLFLILNMAKYGDK